MGYALFAQRKLMLTGLLNGLQLQQTQRSNEQLALATNTLSLQQQLTSLQTAQSQELAQKYEELANSGTLKTIPSGSDADTFTRSNISGSTSSSSATKPSGSSSTFSSSGTSGTSSSGSSQVIPVVDDYNSDGFIDVNDTRFSGTSSRGSSQVYKVVLGDTDGDGIVKASDARQILRWESGLDLDTQTQKDKWSIVKSAYDYDKESNPNKYADMTYSRVALRQSCRLEENKTIDLPIDKIRSYNAPAETKKTQPNTAPTQTKNTQPTFSAPNSNDTTEVKENTDVDGVVSYNGKTYDLNTEEGQKAFDDVVKNEREKIQAQIKQLEEKFKKEEDVINRQIYQVSIKENAIEMEVKRLDTKITAIQKQLEAVEEAEGAGIDRATPKFTGIG